MKNILVLISFVSAVLPTSVVAQCTSSASTYDLIVSDYVALAPSGSQFMFGYVCTGGTLIDSTTCCTRFIHVKDGGIYEAGPMAYGFVYLQNGATFDAHGNTNFFGVDYEDGAVILNYTGPQTLCDEVTFPDADCSTGMSENETEAVALIYPNPASCILNIQSATELADAADVVITNALGEEVLCRHIPNFSSAVSMDISALRPALYFYSLWQNGSVISSGKICVE